MLGALDVVRKAKDDGLVHVGGKTARGSRGSDGKAAHVVGAFLSASRMILAQTACEKKSNETTAIPALIRMLGLRGCLVTIDAGGTCKAIVDALGEAGADYLLPVKANQPKLLEAVQDAFKDYAAVAERTLETVPGLDCHVAEEKGHGRAEKRECVVLRGTEWMGGLAGKWPGVEMAAATRSTVTEKGRKTVTTQYYICSREGLAARQVLEIRRAHWGLESARWVLDVALGDDASKTQADHSARNLTVARHIALNVLWKYKTAEGLDREKSSFNQIMWDLEHSDEKRSVAMRYMDSIAG